MERITASSVYSQVVVLKIYETTGASLSELHLSVEAFGHAIVFSEAPRGRDAPLQI
jgi:hypothetical protein